MGQTPSRDDGKKGATVIVPEVKTMVPTKVEDFRAKDHRGLFIGINYSKTSCPLSGCIKDSEKVRDVVVNTKFPKSAQYIHMRDDVPNDSPYYPSRENILRALKWVFSASPVGDFEKSFETKTNGDEFINLLPSTLIFISFSGHGSQLPDFDGDEADGFDETFCTVDAETGDFGQQIVDDELSALLKSRVPKPNGSVCAILTDCCHSETNLDLPFKLVGRILKRVGTYKDLPIQIIKISGCSDSQCSYEGKIVKDYGGYLTLAWCEAMKIKNAPLLNLMSAITSSVNTRVSSAKQLPNLTTGQMCSVYSRYPM